MKHHVGHQPERLAGVLGEEVRGDSTGVAAAGCDQLHPDEIDVVGKLHGVARGRAFAQQFGDERADTGLAIGVEQRAGAERQGRAGQRQLVLFKQQHDEAVRELNAFRLRELVQGEGACIGRLLRGQGERVEGRDGQGRDGEGEAREPERTHHFAPPLEFGLTPGAVLGAVVFAGSIGSFGSFGGVGAAAGAGSSVGMSTATVRLVGLRYCFITR